MTPIRVQGETYDSPEDALAAANELESRLDDLPESDTANRESLQAHVSRLREAATVEHPSSPEDGAVAPGELVDSQSDDSPSTVDEPEAATEDADEDESGIPPHLKLCPICNGNGVLPIDPPHDPSSEQCPRCSGYGKVITGSHVEGHELRDCPDCNGQGYINRRAQTHEPTRGIAAPSPSWPGAVWDAEASVWQPPRDSTPPWKNATWNEMEGRYE